MKVALVHDYLIQDGGAERVLLALHELYPTAPIFTLFHHPRDLHPALRQADIRPSKLNRLPGVQRYYEWLLPLMAQNVEAIDLAGYDLIISNSSTFAKGAIAPPEALHICYCHNPTRFLWQERERYVHDLAQPRLIKSLLPWYLHRLRQWDRMAAERPDAILTNSRTTQQRIKRYYGRDATVLHPPVDVDRISVSTKSGNYWLAGSRLVPHKRLDLVVQAFAKLNLPLKIFGDGPELERLKSLAGARTEFLGRVDEATKFQLYQDAIAFLHPQMEDFGLMAVEAMAAGKPVLAFGRGGATETVLPGVTGEFFEVQCWEDVANLVVRYDATRYDARVIRERAEQFSKEKFVANWQNILQPLFATDQVSPLTAYASLG